MKLYRRIDVIEGERFDGSDGMRRRWKINKITFCSGSSFETSVYEISNCFPHQINIGDWILRDSVGGIYIYSDREFRSKYKEIYGGN